MSDNSERQRILAHFAAVARALGHEHRLALMEHAAQGERSVEELAERTGLSVANASQHLQQLRRAGLVETRREGKRVHYRLANDSVVDLLSALHRVGERTVEEIERAVSGYIHDPSELEAVSREELLRRLREGDVVLLDARPKDEFAQGHLPGALSMPVDQLEARLSELPSGREVVAYCRGPYCMLSSEAVQTLRARGFRVRRLKDGVAEWRAAGLPIEVNT